MKPSTRRGNWKRFTGAALENLRVSFRRQHPDSVILAVWHQRLFYGPQPSPNRLAVLGANLLVFCHLTGIVYHYARLIFGKNTFTPLERWIASYLPAYTLWSIIVAFAFPLAFGFK